MSKLQLDYKIGSSGLIIYDGSCGVCSTFIGEKKAFFERHGFSLAPLQESWVRDLTKLSEENLLEAIHLYTSDGQVIRGIDFFQQVASKVWWLIPVSMLLRIKILRPFFALIYNAIAKRRRLISQFCGLQSRAFYK